MKAPIPSVLSRAGRSYPLSGFSFFFLFSSGAFSVWKHKTLRHGVEFAHTSVRASTRAHKKRKSGVKGSEAKNPQQPEREREEAWARQTQDIYAASKSRLNQLPLLGAIMARSLGPASTWPVGSRRGMNRPPPGDRPHNGARREDLVGREAATKRRKEKKKK